MSKPDSDSSSRILNDSQKFISTIIWGFIALVGAVLGTVYFTSAPAEAPTVRMSIVPELGRVNRCDQGFPESECARFYGGSQV